MTAICASTCAPQNASSTSPGRGCEPIAGAAVFVLVRRSTPDKVLPEVAPFGGEVIHTSLDDEAEERLRHILEARDAAA